LVTSGSDAGLDEDEVIRRLGADPVDCPLADLGVDLGGADDGRLPRIVWLGPASAGVVVFDPFVLLPVETGFCRQITAGDVILASTFDNSAGGDQYVDVWRDGKLTASPTRYLNPREGGPAGGVVVPFRRPRSQVAHGCPQPRAHDYAHPHPP
jgi:hypothetical protein